MEKKVYVTPAMECLQIRGKEMLVGVSGNGAGVNAGYGGVDTGGTKDPCARERLIEEMEGETEALW